MSAPGAGGPAARRRRILVRLAWVAVLVAVDLWTKALVFGALEPGGAWTERLVVDAHGHPRLVLVGDWLALMLSLNPGAAFGGFADWPWALVLGRLIAVGYLAWLILRPPPGRRWFVASLVLILSGALGNLYDNLRFATWGAWSDPERAFEFGKVRDFIDVYFGVWDWHFPTFNVADSCITVGAVLLVATGLFGRHHEGGEEAPRPAESEGAPAGSAPTPGGVSAPAEHAEGAPGRRVP